MKGRRLRGKRALSGEVRVELELLAEHPVSKRRGSSPLRCGPEAFRTACGHRSLT
ncbi:hypothetical protein BZL30_2619 [Mycobacterium kansasii]|uniref:Uncharacterized protein n=1 Tax=Mycobacterium kansasii TaxID=1768 RepID=A0A1V3XI05_MYCKA|nr:hypothetical protein BZL30_2619 [Mycobacterium kansasii]